MTSIVDGLRALMDRRVRLAEELASVDAELRELRALLGDVGSVRDDDLVTAIVRHLTTNGPQMLGTLVRDTKRSRHLVLSAIDASAGQIELVGNTTRRMVRLRASDSDAAPYVKPEPKPRILAPRSGDVVCVRDGCGVVFRPGGGTSGLYCSRACYDMVRKAGGRQPVPARHVADAPAPEPPKASAEKPASPQPERRCSRCCHRFRPTTATEFICPGCVGAPKVKRAPADPELETTWRPGRDAASLTGTSEATRGMGGSLATEHKSHA